MLKLEKVSKIYLSKSKEKVLALKEINLQFPDKGMVFILGKSGSGKSTLLNIIGGLDQPTEGEVFYNGESLKECNESSYCIYRNSVVGFVFQEFNLLKDLNVKENIALSLQLEKSENIDEKIVFGLETVGLSKDYLTRKIGELSGGEKQRVAIARSIVKDSTIILADEPTGNLDSETGKSVFDTLKSISKQQLVIVVSHDEESARLYADRIVTISDGQIIDDEIIDDEILYDDYNTEDDFSAQSFLKGTKRKRLSNKTCLKLGFNNLRLRKGKTVSVILLSILTIFSLLLSQMLVFYSTESMLTRLIEDNDIKYFQVSQGKENTYSEFTDRGVLFDEKTIDYLYENADCISANRIDSAEDIVNFGLSFVSDPLPLSKDAFYITDFALEKAYEKGGNIIIVDRDRELQIIKEVHTAQNIVGKKMRVRTSQTAYTVAGVIDTSNLTKEQRGGLPNAFYTKNFIGQIKDSVSFRRTGKYSLRFGNEKYRDAFYFSSTIPRGDSVRILTKDGFVESKTLRNSDFLLEEDEVLINYELFYALYGGEEKEYYEKTDFSKINVPEVLETYQEISFINNSTNDVYLNAGNYKVVGIIFSPEHQERSFYLEESKVKDYVLTLYKDYNILLKTDSIDDLEKFLIIYRKDYSGAVIKVGLDVPSYAVEYELRYYYKPILAVFSGVLLIILFFMVANLISFGILKRKKEIGTLSALGMENRDISKIFLLETVIVSSITFVVDAILIIIASNAFNRAFLTFNDCVIPYLRPNIITFIALLGFSFLPLLLATLLPLKKVFKLKPVDAIRES